MRVRGEGIAYAPEERRTWENYCNKYISEAIELLPTVSDSASYLCWPRNVIKFLQTSWIKMLHMHMPHNAFFGFEDWPSLYLGTEELATVSMLWSSQACIKTRELYSGALNQIIFYFDFKHEFNKWDYLIFLAQSRLDLTHQRRYWRQATEAQGKGQLKAARSRDPFVLWCSWKSWEDY